MSKCPNVPNCWGQPLDSFSSCSLAQKKTPKLSLETLHHTMPENLVLFYAITRPRAICPGFYQHLLHQYLGFYSLVGNVHMPDAFAI